MGIKPVFLLCLLALAGGAASTEHPIPFAYSRSNGNLVLLYQSKCPIKNPKEWKTARIVFQVRGWMDVCWSKDFYKPTENELVTLCSTKKEDGTDVVDGNGCQFVLASKFIKGSPFPPRAF